MAKRKHKTVLTEPEKDNEDFMTKALLKVKNRQKYINKIKKNWNKRRV